MFQSIILHFLTIFALVLYFNGTSNAKKCADCITISSCEGAMSMLENLQKGEKDSLRRVKNALCGFEGYDPLVCCSKFSLINNTIEKHPNEALLADCANYRKISAPDSLNPLNEFPWMVFFVNKINHESRPCGGSIINSRYILTAAHCLLPFGIINDVRIGESDVSTSHNCPNKNNYICESIQNIKVQEITIHPSYTNSIPSQYDIGLLRLSKPIDFTKRNAEPICLPLSQTLRNNDLEGKIATAIGWGYVTTIDHIDEVLKVDLQIKMDGDCLNYINNTKKIICAAHNEGEACYGEGGGPMMIKKLYNGGYHYIQYGIVSHRRNECTFGNPGVFTDVTKFIPWILDNIKQ